MESSFPSPQRNQTPPSWWSTSKEDPKSEAFRKGKKLTHQRRFARKTNIWKYQFETPFSLWGEPDKVVLVLCVCLCHMQSILFRVPETWCISYPLLQKEGRDCRSFFSNLWVLIYSGYYNFAIFILLHKTYSVWKKRFLLLLEIESALGKRSLIKANQNAIHQHKFQVD